MWYLLQLLQDKDRNIRRDATWALGRIGKRSEDVVPALIQALQDEDEIVRRAVTFALAETGAENTVPVLILALL